MLACTPLTFNLHLISWAVSLLFTLPSILLTIKICVRPFLTFAISSLVNVYPMAMAPQYAPDKVQKILVGNKSDEVEKRQVATAQGVKVGSLLTFALGWLIEFHTDRFCYGFFFFGGGHLNVNLCYI